MAMLCSGTFVSFLAGFGQKKQVYCAYCQMMGCEGAFTHTHAQCAVKRVHLKRLLKYVCMGMGIFKLVTHHTCVTALGNLSVC